jgi:anti-sigma regulatory factor (Ser/Thr protein kinase)
MRFPHPSERWTLLVADIDPARGNDIASRLRLDPPAVSVVGRPILLCGLLPDPDTLPANIAGVIEDTGQPVEDVLAAIDAATASSLYVNLSSTTAYRAPLATLVSLWACRHTGLSNSEPVETALQEAIANAVIHGNLELNGIPDLSIEALDAFSNELRRRLNDSPHAERRVEITVQVDPGLRIIVTDQGAGFDFNGRLSTDGGSRSAFGRGLKLIESSSSGLHFGLGGRQIIMDFAA